MDLSIFFSEHFSISKFFFSISKSFDTFTSWYVATNFISFSYISISELILNKNKEFDIL